MDAVKQGHSKQLKMLNVRNKLGPKFFQAKNP